MKKVRILVILFSIFLTGCIASPRPSKPSSDPDGFRGVKWETSISTLKDMEKFEQDKSASSDLVLYKRKGDPLKIGNAKLKNIFYLFWMENFYSVWIDFEGDENYEILKKELFQRLGEAPGSDEFAKETHKRPDGKPSEIREAEGFYAWWGRTTEVVLTYSKERHNGNLSVKSTKLAEEKRAYEKQKKKEER